MVLSPDDPGVALDAVGHRLEGSARGGAGERAVAATARDPGAFRLPWYGTLDLSINKIVDLPSRLPKARVGMKFYNLAEIHTEHLYAASQLLSSIITFGPQPNKAIVGLNAFAHEAGIHQDGYLKEKSTYEIIDPKSVGVPEGKLVLGKHSGCHALKQRCETLGFSLSKVELDIVYTQFTALADRKKGILDEEIASLIVAAGHTTQTTFAGK